MAGRPGPEQWEFWSETMQTQKTRTKRDGPPELWPCTAWIGQPSGWFVEDGATIALYELDSSSRNKVDTKR